MVDTVITPFNAAPQHGPRPLPLFIEMLRSETAASPERRAAALADLWGAGSRKDLLAGAAGVPVDGARSAFCAGADLAKGVGTNAGG